MLSEKKQTENASYCRAPLILNVQNKQIHRNKW
jgi:hypothetical protein